MICIDVNLLLRATNPKDSRHEETRRWFEDQMNGGHRIGLPWATLVSFIRLSTNKYVRTPMALDEALVYVEEWLEWETVWVPEPTDRHGALFAQLLRKTNRPRLVPDAHIAALAIEHNLTLCSDDSDMRMFPGLKFHNPLQ